MKTRDISHYKIVKMIFIIINKILFITNFDNVINFQSRSQKEREIPFDIKLEKEFMELYERCKEYSMTSVERMFSLYKAVDYVVKKKIPGDIVECGVWKGGSMMLCALTLLKMNDKERKIYLYDTYNGMTQPTEKDIRSYDGFKAKTKYNLLKKKNLKWDYASLDEVKKNLFSTKYPKENLIFGEGKVEDTIPNLIPKKISLLRLDTDWYESTYHELNHLYPKLSVNGILILDDYGHWKGAKDATDQYIQENNIKILFNRNDKTGRLGIKMN